MKLSKQQIDKLWGESGPYSEVNIITQTRILDDSISRVFVEVEAHINPLTFEIIKQNKKTFKDDEKIMQLLAHARYTGMDYGYVICAFSKEYTDETVMDEAKEALEYARDTVIKTHIFVMDLLGI